MEINVSIDLQLPLIPVNIAPVGPEPGIVDTDMAKGLAIEQVQTCLNLLIDAAALVKDRRHDLGSADPRVAQFTEDTVDLLEATIGDATITVRNTRLF
jgi:hypothetical protein